MDRVYGLDMTDRHTFMEHAIRLAQKPCVRTSPNPRVGCVIIAKDEIIGEGWHEGPGTPHAEVMALQNAGMRAKGAIAVVTLEPCNHQGRTGPCTKALINAGISEVVFAVADPNPVATGGAEALAEAGIKVSSGLLAEEATALNESWFFAQKARRPYFIGKSAASLDGRTATASGESKWITGAEARAHAHSVRRNVDAILVGVQTVIDDDPALTARDRGVATVVDRRQPRRIILDSQGRCPIGAKALDRMSPAPLIVTTDAMPFNAEVGLKEVGAEVVRLSTNESGHPDLLVLSDFLFEQGVMTLLVEGGATVLGSFFDAGLLDELHLYLARKVIGGGPGMFGGEGTPELSQASAFLFDEPECLGTDFLFIGKRQKEAN